MLGSMMTAKVKRNSALRVRPYYLVFLSAKIGLSTLEAFECASFKTGSHDSTVLCTRAYYNSILVVW